MSPEEAPELVLAPCPDCGEDTEHRVLKGTMGTKGAPTLDAVVRCEACERTHHVVLRQAPLVTLPVVMSFGASSWKTTVELPEDEPLRVGDELTVDERNAQITGLELDGQRRVEEALVKDVRTLWVKEFETVTVHFAVNLKRKTISKEMETDPDTEFSVGQELVFDRLRVTVHAIKGTQHLIRRGSIPARDIVRVFTRPTRLGKPYRPRPDERARQRRQAGDRPSGHDEE